jgi:hypothetical protein
MKKNNIPINERFCRGKIMENNLAMSIGNNFINHLRNEFELSLGVCKGVRELAEFHYNPIHFNELNHPMPGQIITYATHTNEPAGKSRNELRRVKIILTLDAGEEDDEVKREYGLDALRRVRISRITSEAYDQSALLTIVEIANLLMHDSRTIKRDIKEIRASGQTVITRGYIKDIGPKTHRSQIINLYMEGLSEIDIKIHMKHSLRSVERYLQIFGRVVYCIEKKMEHKEIQFLVGISQNLMNEYAKLHNQYNSKEYRFRLDEIITMANIDHLNKKKLVRL